MSYREEAVMYVKKEFSQEYTELYNSPKAAPSAVPVNQAVIFPKSSADGEMPIQFIEFFIRMMLKSEVGRLVLRITLLLLRSQKMQTSYC